MKIIKIISSILMGIILVILLLGSIYGLAYLMAQHPLTSLVILGCLVVIIAGCCIGYWIYDSLFDDGDKYDY